MNFGRRSIVIFIQLGGGGGGGGIGGRKGRRKNFKIVWTERKRFVRGHRMRNACVCISRSCRFRGINYERYVI